jgi:hypothetical protein
VRLGQQGSLRASGWSRAWVRSVHRLGEQVGGDVQRRAFNGAQRGTVHSLEREAAALKPARGGGGEVVCGGPVRAMARHGLTRRGDVQERWPNGVWRWRSPASGGLPRGTDHGTACITHRKEGGAADGPTDAGRSLRACTAAYGDEADVAGRDVACPGVSVRVGRQPFRSSLVQEGFSQTFELKWANI